MDIKISYMNIKIMGMDKIILNSYLILSVCHTVGNSAK